MSGATDSTRAPANSADDSAEERNAAIFDFDGVLYSPSAKWKIIDARLGVVGSRISWERGLQIYREASGRFDGIQLTECFAPDEFEFATAPGQTNLTLPQHLMKTAQNHAFRGHELLVISRYAFRDFLRVNERFMGQPGPLPLKGNPFEEARMLVTENYREAHSDTTLSLRKKFEAIQMMLQRQGDALSDADADESADRPTLSFARIYLYYTEDSYAELSAQLLEQEREQLLGGRNAIVRSLIAEPG